MRSASAFVMAACAAAFATAASAQDADRTLRVCSDPNNLPFSNEAGEGFENAIAEIVADELDADLTYAWWAQRRGFIRNTLNAGDCDLVVGVPAGYELVETTQPYYRSTYVFVYRSELEEPLHSILDPRLRKLDIGVHLTGDDGANPPPAHALGMQGIVDNVTGYLIYGDYREPNPPARLVQAVAGGEVDVAAVWGPLGGYFAQRAKPALELQAITDTDAFGGLPFEYSIAMGVRNGETALRDEIQAVIDRRREDVLAVLRDYHVPLVPHEAHQAEEPAR